MGCESRQNSGTLPENAERMPVKGLGGLWRAELGAGDGSGFAIGQWSFVIERLARRDKPIHLAPFQGVDVDFGRCCVDLAS
jgi:hypothetical protein